jgi:hypothetical protein
MQVMERNAEVEQPPASRGTVRVLWKVLAGVLVVTGLAFGTYQVIVLLSHEERTEAQTLPAADLTAVHITNESGQVRIVGTDGDEVAVTAKISDGLRATGERRDVVGRVLELEGTCPNFGSDFCSVDYELQVPRHLDLVLNSENGSIEVTGIDGALEVDGDNGSIELSQIGGEIRVSNDNGRITATALRSSNVEAENDNARIELEFATPPMTLIARNDNASIEIVVPDTPEGYRVEPQNDNGSVNIDVRQRSDSPRSMVVENDNASIEVLTGI